ncbi:MAG: hypothetical protein M1823_004648 [Watsoniomyces obsoletus]|nr:MAG: hypothetical protein M1823_004648 [Watsoniomyces obsoletus]
MAAQTAHDEVNHPGSASERSLADGDASNNSKNQQPSSTNNVKAPESALPNGIETADHATTTQETTSGAAADTNDIINKGQLTVNEGQTTLGDAQAPTDLKDHQDTRSSTPLTNGDKLSAPETDDIAVQPASVDLSGGSDAENVRPDHHQASTQAEGESNSRGHSRSNSVRKQASFKAVSITKSFLTKAATGSAQPTKTATEKAGNMPNGQPTASGATALGRPRLVAKSGSGRENALRGSASAAAAGRPTAPDPSQVWNKNRPAQPAAPKQFTDEELKQQYGIHLATRLQTDETSKESKWADIDDDDDDWAPETIEWNDGTKMSLATPGESANQGPPKLPTDEPKNEKPTEKGKSDAPQASSADVLPPEGAKTSNVSSGPVKSAGLVLKGAPEKPTLVAKPLAPVPVKSPWAPLPPVEKVSPVTIKPQQAAAPPPGQLGARMQKEPYGVDPMPSMNSPAKEMAADDFNRSWREHQPDGNRELFNSHSGRYEPVNNNNNNNNNNSNRRGSVRGEQQNFRQPAVLQRPSNVDNRGPAEPSAAFQTHRSSGQDMNWGRRRASSNLSGGSGPFPRRMSVGKGPEMYPAPNEALVRGRQGSQQPIPLESPVSRSSSQVQTTQPRAIPIEPDRHGIPSDSFSSAPSQLSPRTIIEQYGHLSAIPNPIPEPPLPHAPSVVNESLGPLPEPPELSAVEMQKEVMRQSREQARKRRQEQEEREKRELQERIRRKMQQMEKIEELKKQEKAAAAQAGDRKVSARMDAKAAQSSSAVEVPKSAPDALSKPPVLESSDQVKQYGMMKVHDPVLLREPTKASDEQRPVLTAQGLTSANILDVPDLPMTSSAEAKQREMDKPIMNGISQPSADVAARREHSIRPERLLHERSGPSSWNKSTTAEAETRKAWGGNVSPVRPTHMSQIWGPPSMDGPSNKTPFPGENASRSNVDEGPMGRPPASRAPGPIGPPGAAHRPTENMNLRNNTWATPAAGPHPGARSQSRFNTPSEPTRPGPQQQQPRIGTGIVPSTRRNMAPPVMDASRQNAVTEWGRWSDTLATERAAMAQAFSERQAKAREVMNNPTLANAESRPLPAFQEKWRPSGSDVSGIKETTRIVGGGHAELQQAMATPAASASTPAAVSNATTTAPTAPTGPPPAPLAATGRESRFFPQTTPPRAPPSTATVPAEISSPASSKGSTRTQRWGPPPEMRDHPVFDGDVKRPLVNLPGPKPVVKLPPLASQTPAPTEPTVKTPPGPSQSPSPPRQSETPQSWQERFNGLFGRKSSVSNKSQMSTVSSASKAPLDVSAARVSATVSLPTKGSGSGDETSNSSSIISGDYGDFPATRANEEMLFEEREFGSLPTVKLPTQVPSKGWQPARSPQHHRSKARSARPVQAVSKEAYSFKEQYSGSGYPIEINILGSIRKTVYSVRSRGQGPRNRNSSRGNYRERRRGGGGPRSREVSGNNGPSNRPSPQGLTPRQSQGSVSGSGGPGSTDASATWANRVSGQ